MNREETKKKLVEELKKAMAPIEYGGDREHAPEVHYPSEEEIADALIAAGLRFGETLTATFDLMALEREHDLERRLANAEHRAEVAERALQLMARGECTFASPEYYREQAEKELAEEEKE